MPLTHAGILALPGRAAETRLARDLKTLAVLHTSRRAIPVQQGAPALDVRWVMP
jgi:hypothetical protein